MNFNSLITWICDLLIIICPLLIAAYLGFRLGLKSKRPFIVVDCVKIDQKQTVAFLNNIGESPAVNIQIGDCIFILQDKPGQPFNDQLKDKQVIFKFEKTKYIEAGKQGQVKVSATLNGKDLSKDALYFYSFGLHRFKNVFMTYKDNFGNSYKSKIEKLDVK